MIRQVDTDTYGELVGLSHEEFHDLHSVPWVHLWNWVFVTDDVLTKYLQIRVIHVH